MRERLQKVIAGAGICSRREAERLIAEGEVSVNGETVRRAGVQVDPSTDRVEVQGRKLRGAPPRQYIALHKPRGCVTTAKDPEGRSTVLDLLAGVGARVFPVGRLDYSAEGLLLMTNDGELAYALMRPGRVAKTYRVKVKGSPAPEALERLRRGLVLEGRPLLPVKAHLESGGETSWVRITLHEGRKNQIVRMMEAIGHPVRRLRRLSIGPLQLGTLPAGRWRRLDVGELDALRRALRGEGGREAPPVRGAGMGRGPRNRRSEGRPRKSLRRNTLT